MLNGRPLYKQDGIGTNFFYMDRDDRYCFGPDANLTCSHHREVMAELPEVFLCPQELKIWKNLGDSLVAPQLTCNDIHPNTVKPTNLDIVLKDPLKVFLVRFYDSRRG